jgi:CheY-like chemotaxis protein
MRVADSFSVPPRFTILIADRNPNVRGFLQREMSREGYAVRPAESAEDLVRLARGAGPVHLVILDPDLPGAAPPVLLQELQDRLPQVPIVLHTHDPQAARSAAPRSAAPKLIVEKTGSSIVRLKQLAAVLATGCSGSAPTPKNS